LTRSPLPQLQVTRGAHRLIGNVFHRRSEHPGDGIELIAVENPAATSAEASAIVRGNLIGGPLPLKPPQDSGAERNYVRQVADLPPEDVAARTGHYVTALRTVGPVLAKIQHNVIGVVSGRVKKPHVVAEFERPRSLRLAENRLLAVNASTGGRPLVIFRAPSAAKFRKNWLTGIDLWLLPSIVDPKAPTKRTGLSFNRFERSVVVIGVSVTGSGALARTREDLTTPDDVQISDNTFVATPGKCPLTMPAPYDFVDNFRELDNQDTNEESVKVCPPRTKAAPASSPSSA
jgi:hypothetical protein